ncbi:MAG: dihydrolipoyl dehydrogenase [Alloprevotella sp.]|nr:dihydrolipoyl dehydrogenase [Alloprevotella sp.]
MQNVDLFIIGAGPGGYETALSAAASGLSVALADKAELGGTCLNVGCIPTKSLCHTAEVLDEARKSAEVGINLNGSIELDLPSAVERKNQIVAQLRAGIAAQLKRQKVEYLQGEAKLLSQHEVSVTLSDGTEKSFCTKDIIIAAGSRTAILPIEGANLPQVLTSTELLDLQDVPERLCIIGGGVIGLEFASIFNTFGSKVTVVEFCPEVLPFFDKDIAKRLRLALKKSGIEFRLGSRVTAIRNIDKAVEIAFTKEETEDRVEADVVLMAVGRRANTEAVNLAAVGIETDRRGIVVDEHFQTNVPHIYAVGDINGRMQLAHAATFQGKSVLAHILGHDEQITHDLCPAVVFTRPELAMVGLTEEQLKNSGTDYRVIKSQYGANGRALTMGAAEGLVKLLVGTDDKVLGAHILGAHAGELIHEMTAWIRCGATLDTLRTTIHAHPTLSELLIG